MSSAFHPLPATMPFWAKVDIMLRRGEARDVEEAVRKLRPKRLPKKPAKPQPYRLPYADNLEYD
jgi:hypothetical protein